MPPAPVRAVRRSRSAIEIACGALAAVENTRDQALLAQAPRLGRAENGTVLDQQLDALTGHGGRL